MMMVSVTVYVADCSELMYRECLVTILVPFLPTSTISLFLLPSHFYPYSLLSDTALSFEFSSYTVIESQPILPVFIVKEPMDADTEIEYQFSVMATDITATAPDDYRVPAEFLVFIDPDRQQLPYLVAIEDDALIEGNETFELELFVAEQPHFLLGSITRVTVTIIDDDINEVDEFFSILLELVSAVNPHRVDLGERNISLLRIYDDDGECDCVCGRLL